MCLSSHNSCLLAVILGNFAPPQVSPTLFHHFCCADVETRVRRTLGAVHFNPSVVRPSFCVMTSTCFLLSPSAGLCWAILGFLKVA